MGLSNLFVPRSLGRRSDRPGQIGLRVTEVNREERNRLEDALPRQKGNVSIKYERGGYRVTARANYFGNVEYKPTNDANDETFGAKVLFDLNVSYEVMPGATVTVGANNILNTFPDKHCNDLASAQNTCGNYSDGRFPYSRRVTQFGMNGGFYYARLGLRL